MSEKNQGKEPKIVHDTPAVESAAAAVEVPAIAAAEATTAPIGPRVFGVSIPDCLIAEAFIVADTAEDAYAVYKAQHGITTHAKQQVVREVKPGSKDHAAAVATHEAELAKAQG
jgi:hypothetical protein